MTAETGLPIRHRPAKIPKNLSKYTNKLFFGWFLGVADTNDVIQKIEKTLNNTHTTTQKLTNNSFRNTKKHPFFVTVTSITGDPSPFRKFELQRRSF